MIAIGSDHGGFSLKKIIIDYFEKNNIAYKDFGTYTTESCDYHIYARAVAKSVAAGECEKGIIICGTGVGVSIVANKIKGIRAAVCSDTFTARSTREHNDSNILTMGERVVGQGLALDIVKTFLETDFSNEERHLRRIREIEEQ